MNKKLEVIEFYTTWCGICKLLSPIFDDLIRENKGKEGLIIRKKDAEVSVEDADKYDVMSVPMIIFIKDGEVVERFYGAMAKSQLQELINKYYEELPQVI